ncbi:MAG: glycosyltransferase [Clostridia bacterium]|nr:glycosyltransferase [Clostridia bacterium]
MECKISFIIPVFNAQQYLRECIDSIIAQDGFEQTEIILVDDGSTDVSSAICDMYALRFDNIKVIHQKNSGVSAARNNGISASNGEYITFVDADDYLLPGILPKVIEAAQNSPDLVFYNFISEYKDFYDYIQYPFKKGNLDEDYIKKEIVEFMLSDSSLNSVWNKIFKKKIIFDNNISFPVDRKYGEDKIFVLSFLTKCKSAFFISHYGYYYRYVQSGAIQRTRNDYAENFYKDFDYTIESYKNFNINPDTVYKKCCDFLAVQIISNPIMAYQNSSSNEFKETMNLFFNNERLMSDVRKFYNTGVFKSDSDVKIIKAILNRDSDAISRHLKFMQLKTDIYAHIHKNNSISKKEPIKPETKNSHRLKGPYKITVFTPVYNRRHTIQRVFDGLMSQTFKDFEWLIVDDGSTDNLKEVIDLYSQQADFPIRYYYKTNGGKHTAMNFACNLIDSDYCIVLDSDDSLPPDSIQNQLNIWKSIPENERESYWCVVGLCSDVKTGEVIGDCYPENINRLDNPKAVASEIKGDKSSCIRSDILKQFPFPEPKGTTFITESIVWNEIDKKYKQFYTNDIVKIVYRNEPDSLSTAWYRDHIQEGYISNYYWMKSNLNDGCGSAKEKLITLFRLAYYGCVCGKKRKEISGDIDSFKMKMIYNLIFWITPIIKKLRHDKLYSE